MKHQEIIFGVAGQSFTFDPPEWSRPSAPTVQVLNAQNDDDSAAAELAVNGACAVDAVDTTLAAAAARGDATVTVTSAASIAVDRRYIIAAGGAKEIIDVRRVDGTVVTLKRPLSNAWAIAAALQGCRITVLVLDAWAATKAKLTDVMLDTIRTDVVRDELAWPPSAAGYRLRWTYTAGGVAYVHASYADLVRYPTVNTVSPMDVDNKYAGWIDRLPIDHQADQGTRLIAQAFEDVKMDALGDAQVLRRIRDTQVLHRLVVHRANQAALEAQESAGADVAAQLELARKTYQRHYDQLLREPKVAVDQAGGGASSTGRPLPIFRR